MKRSLFILLLIWGSLATAQDVSQNVTALEYFFDTDPGRGNGTAIALAPGLTVTQTPVLNTSALSGGFHRIYFRARVASGLWSMPYGYTVYVDSLSSTVRQIAAIEYYWDNDPGYGLGASITVSSAATFVDIADNIPTDTLSIGFHQLFMRAQDDAGIWGMSESRLVYVDNSLGAVRDSIDQLEYFWDHDPGYGNGAMISIASPDPLIDIDEALATDTLSNGFHNLFVRARTLSGTWGVPESRLVYLDNAAGDVQDTLVAAEYFWDSDPGYGNGRALTISSPASSLQLSTTIATDTLSVGFHNLYTRVQNSSGQWGIPESRLVYIDLGGNVLQNVSELEYFFDTDPGYGFGTIVPIDTPSVEVLAAFIASTDTLALGEHLIGVRAKSEDGKWGITETSTFTLFLESRELDSVALHKVYEGLVGSGWTNNTNWLTTSIDQWYGVSITSNRVSALDLSSNNLVGQVPAEIGYLSNLETLDLSGNVLSDSFPDETVDLTILSALYLNDNQLNHLPDLSSIDSLQTVVVDNNNLDFGDLEYLAGISSYSYTGQTLLNSMNIDSMVAPGDTLSFDVTIDGSSNTYQWYLDGVVVPDQTSSTLSIDSFRVVDTGYYQLTIANTLLPDLEFTSGTYHLFVHDSLAVPLDTDPPVVVGDTLVSIAENTTVVNTYSAGELVTWSLRGTDAASFDISVDGELTLLTAADFESPADANADNVYELVLEASDSLSNSTSHILEITITDVNDNVPVITDPGAISVDENSSVSAQVVTLTYTDLDTTSATYTWSIISGNDDINSDSNLPFTIGGDGIIIINDSADLDFETQNSFNLEVTLNDEVSTDTLTLLISLNDVNDNAPVITDPGVLAIDENSPFSTQIVALTYTDADTTSTTYSWSITSGNNDINTDSNLPFSLDGLSGILTVNDSADIDYELVTQFDVEIALNDGQNTDTLLLVIAVNDVFEGPDPGTALDSAALLTLYDSLGGATWTSTNWKSGANL
ncbi:MAG: hypothetical protein CMB80_04970, partial [Flammeovirgaceae bacterium]|nr:hypothetical protein [Flammeovirgaceae bacterium]